LNETESRGQAKGRDAARYSRGKPVRYAARGKYINGTIGNQLTGHMLACTLTAPRRATVLRPWVGTVTLVREADMVMADILVCTV